MTAVIDHQLLHEDEGEEMSAAARNQTMKRHAHIGRAGYFLDRIRKF